MKRARELGFCTIGLVIDVCCNLLAKAELSRKRRAKIANQYSATETIEGSSSKRKSVTIIFLLKLLKLTLIRKYFQETYGGNPSAYVVLVNKN